MLKYSSRHFTFLHDVFGFFNKSSAGYQVGQYAPGRAIPDHSPLTREDSPLKLNLTTLANGVKIVSETGGFPGSVHLGVTLLSGTRDETAKNSGLVHALSQTALKTNIRTNEQINYCMIQMSGGEFSMTYNQDFMHYATHCLAHDTYDLIQMISDCVLDEKTVMDEEAAQWRLDEYWKFRNANITVQQRINELWLSTAYGFTGFGMPVAGFESNFQNIGYYYMNSFRKTYITPERMIVWGAGIQNHQEFVDAVSPYYAPLDAHKAKERPKSVYIGGDYRELAESEVTHVSLSFQGFGHRDPQVSDAYILKYIIGKSKLAQLSRATTHFHQKYKDLLYIDPHHTTFEDIGNFRINFAAPNDKIGEICDAVVKEMHDLVNVTEEEVNRAKKHFLRDINNKFLDPKTRLQKLASLVGHTGKIINLKDYIQEFESVTLESVKKTTQKLFKSFPTVVTIGGNIHAVPTAQAFHNKLK